MSRRAHLTWRLLALFALVVAAAWPRSHVVRREPIAPARVELLSATMKATVTTTAPGAEP